MSAITGRTRRTPSRPWARRVTAGACEVRTATLSCAGFLKFVCSCSATFSGVDWPVSRPCIPFHMALLKVSVVRTSML